MKKVLLVTLLGTSALRAMEAEVLPNALPLSKEDMWLVHQTRIFPQNGRMIAGGLVRVGMEGGSSLIQLSQAECLALAKNTITSWRNSIHWSLNSSVYPHTLKNFPNESCDRTDSSIIILEPMKAFAGKNLYGYWQDVFHFGGHQLTQDAIILVKEGDTTDQELIGDFKGTVRTYTTSLREAVEEVLTEQGAPILYPCVDGLPEMTHNPEQPIMLRGTPYDCSTLSTCAELDNTLHSETRLGDIQKQFVEVIQPFRNAQWAHYYLTHCIKRENACLICKKTAQQLASKKLLQCSRCKVAQYCSADCQRANWSAHKQFCQFASSLTDGISESHLNYLRYLGNLSLEYNGVRGFDEVIKVLTRELDALIQSSPEKDKLLLTHYKAYITGMVHDLYNTNEQYQVRTLEGFLAFATMIQKKYAELATEFDGSN